MELMAELQLRELGTGRQVKEETAFSFSLTFIEGPLHCPKSYES